jgi:hypothetical protein
MLCCVATKIKQNTKVKDKSDQHKCNKERDREKSRVRDGGFNRSGGRIRVNKTKLEESKEKHENCPCFIMLQ